MKFSLNWLSSYFAQQDNSLSLLSSAQKQKLFATLTNAGIEIENELTLDDDSIIELKITPNRGDCLSLRGLVREVAALMPELILNTAGIELLATEQSVLDNLSSADIVKNTKQTIKAVVDVGCSTVCPHYALLTINDLNNQITLPETITKRLDQSGIASISPVVDITNYVMLLLGQPLHAFATDIVGNNLHVRYAKNNETITLLDKRQVKCDNTTLVITDSSDHIAAIAGVMGGLDSAVTNQTTNIVLESACFSPNVISGKAKYYGLHSEAAHRFERGVDANLTIHNLALQYAAKLIIKYCGGTIGSSCVVNAAAMQATTITVHYQQINALLGITLADDTIITIVQRLGCTIVTHDAQTINLTTPSYRFDLNIAEDIIEEIARIYGYDNIPAIAPQISVTLPETDADSSLHYYLKQKLVTLGFNEIIAYAFLEEKYENIFGNKQHQALHLANPIAGLNVLRTSLIADLVKALCYNLNHGFNCGHNAIRLFELGRVFYSETTQMLKLSGLMYGQLLPSNWAHNDKQLVDFFTLKGVMQQLFVGLKENASASCKNIQFKPTSSNGHSILHPGMSAVITYGGQELGIIGKLHPAIAQECDLDANLLPYVFEIDLATLANCCQEQQLLIAPVSNFQKVERDLAFNIASELSVATIIDVINQAQINYLTNITVFDIYQGTQQVNLAASAQRNQRPVGSETLLIKSQPFFKSVALRFVFQAMDKTLTDSEINTAMTAITSLITTQFSAQIRTGT